MSEDTRVSGAITITPPLTWAQVRESPYLDTPRGWDEPGHYAEVVLKVVERETDTADGVAIIRSVDRIEAAMSPQNGYHMREQLQRIVDQFGDGHVFAGHLECVWAGNAKEMWRLVVQGRTVVEVRPRLVWPGEPMPGFEPAVDRDDMTLWLAADGLAGWLHHGDDQPEGWQRLYVEARPGGESA